ncbi:hypothetical protein [uncultured Flavobacterium sp.]|uniref:hypothetical protein n=1 Tax=uncultured Flavobacterium sp. TaxID=165435 RepID=UPI0025D10169|nr:hypothetical protein [uncultured Flavobacterium sp.]
MKKLLFISFLMACGATAMANTNDDHVGPPVIEKAVNITAEAKKIPAARAEKPKESIKPQKQAAPAKFCTSVDGSRFGLSLFIADFVNSSNIKLTNLLLAK